MKTNKWTQALVLTISLVLSAGAFAQQQYREANEGGNGGGGVNQNGRYMTFYSAGIFVDKNELTIDQIPQLRYVADLFMSTRFIPTNISSSYFDALVPSTERSYYSVQNNHFTPEVRTRLIAEYSRVTGLDATKLALFAITDTSKKVTYLLPEFYRLRPTEQSAILFHEAHWIKNPKTTYQNVVDAEISFQRYLENMNSKDSLLKFLEKLVPRWSILTAALILDFEDGSLNQLMKSIEVKEGRKSSAQQVLLANDVLGVEFTNCYASKDIDDSYQMALTCNQFAKRHLYFLAKNYANSAFIKILLDYMGTTTPRVDAIVGGRDTSHRTFYSGFKLVHTFDQARIVRPQNTDSLVKIENAYYFEKTDKNTKASKDFGQSKSLFISVY